MSKDLLQITIPAPSEHTLLQKHCSFSVFRRILAQFAGCGGGGGLAGHHSPGCSVIPHPPNMAPELKLNYIYEKTFHVYFYVACLHLHL